MKKAFSVGMRDNSNVRPRPEQEKRLPLDTEVFTEILLVYSLYFYLLVLCSMLYIKLTALPPFCNLYGGVAKGKRPFNYWTLKYPSKVA